MSPPTTNLKCMGRGGSSRWPILNGITIAVLSILVANGCCNYVWQENVRPKLYVEMGKFSNYHSLVFNCLLPKLRVFFCVLWMGEHSVLRVAQF